jgi:hypothetical protein
MTRRRLAVAIGGVATVVALGALGASSCGSQRADDGSRPETSVSAPPIDRSTTSAAEHPPTSGAATTSTSATSTSGTTIPVATTVPPGPLTLAVDGVGVQRFGQPADAVIAALSAELGPPSDDRTEPASSSSYGLCPGTEVRVAEWGGFALLFTDGDTVYAPGGSFRFFAWRLVDRGAATPPLGTAAGIDLGDTTADVREAYGTDVQVFEDDVQGPAFTVGSRPDQLRGDLTSVTDAGTVVGLAAGAVCAG